MHNDPIQALAAYAAGLHREQLPARVIDKAKACLLYGLAVGIGSVHVCQPHRAAAAMPEQASTATSATRLLDGARASADAAAFANAVLMHARCQEDAHPAGHIGVVVLPAALAAAEADDRSGDDLLAAVVAGYEVALRIGRDHERDLSARGFRTTPAYGVFGAAVAVGRLAGLDAADMLNALALAASNAAGLREFVRAGSDEFPYQAGFAARNAITSARLAALGANGAASALTGKAGFFAAFATPSPAYAARMADDLGTQFEMETVGYKPYPTCQYHRGVVRGARQLATEAAGVALLRMEIRMHPSEADFVGVRYVGPFQGFPQTFMSAPFCAALSWVRGPVTLAGMHRFDDPAVLGLLDRIEIIADPTRAPYQPQVTATLTDGRQLLWGEAAGAEAYNLDWEIAQRMSASLTAEVGVPESTLATLIAAVDALDRGFNARRVVQAATAAAAAAGAKRDNGSTALSLRRRGA